MSATVDPLVAQAAGGLVIHDVTKVPAAPDDAHWYKHRPDILGSALRAWQRRDVILTLAERDIRATYKQVVLGFGWAVLTPVLTMLVFSILLGHVKSFQTKGVPYPLEVYSGMWVWGIFGGALGGGAGSLITNKSMMSKTHFPRECFPLSQVLESVFTSALALVPLVILFARYTYMPKLATLWVPLYLAIEIPFVIGVVLLVSSVIVQARDLQQVLPMFMQFGMLLTPIIWPLGRFVRGSWVPLYSLFNPMGPIIDGMKGSMLQGFRPHFALLSIALCGALGYLVVGYRVFKRLEVNFADVA